MHLQYYIDIHKSVRRIRQNMETSMIALKQPSLNEWVELLKVIVILKWCHLIICLFL